MIFFGIRYLDKAIRAYKTAQRASVAAFARCFNTTGTAKIRCSSDYVFLGKTTDKQIHDLPGAWQLICLDAAVVEVAAVTPARLASNFTPEIATIPNLKASLSVQDLRHTNASVLVSSGFSLPIIGTLPGHTQAQTSNRYGNLLGEPLQEAVSKATDRMGKQ